MTRLLVVLAFSAVGCTSPEATRTRGQGEGADVGNRARVVMMHEGSEPFWRTPERMTFAHPELEAAEHASQLSRP